MERLPDPERSYAVLIGTGSYQFGDLAGRPLPAVRNNLTDLTATLTDPNCGGFRRDHCTVLLDPTEGDTVIRALFANAHRATDTLLVYFAGHGLAGPRSKELYLTLANTNPDDPLWWRAALGYDEIRRVLLDNCRAMNRVVILDCCYSGRAIPETAGIDVAGAFDIRGSYTLAAVGGNQLAYAPPGDPHTAFTGELLKVLRDGVPQGPQLLTLNTVYLELDAALTSRDLHRPRQNNNDTAAGLALTRNPAYARHPSTQTPGKIESLGRHSWKPDESPRATAANLAGSPAAAPPELADVAHTPNTPNTSWTQRPHANPTPVEAHPPTPAPSRTNKPHLMRILVSLAVIVAMIVAVIAAVDVVHKFAPPFGPGVIPFSPGTGEHVDKNAGPSRPWTIDGLGCQYKFDRVDRGDGKLTIHGHVTRTKPHTFPFLSSHMTYEVLNQDHRRLEAPRGEEWPEDPKLDLELPITLTLLDTDPPATQLTITISDQPLGDLILRDIPA